MYGEFDLSKLPVFKGGFINFGYWSDELSFTNKPISVMERITASMDLYKAVADRAEISEEHAVLEVGCGLGYGSAFLSNHYNPKLVVGLDISPDQIARAKQHQLRGLTSGKQRFALGEAEWMPFTDHSFDRILSIEAAQHFSSMEAFAKEVVRILKPGGKLVMTSFFPTSSEGVDAIEAIVPDYHVHGSKNTTEDVQKNLSMHMESVNMTSIGKNVWHGFSKWLDQIGFQTQWSKIWYYLYEKNLIDYVIYQATAPEKRD